MRITVDPGHGGEDNGAVHGNVKESLVNLQISRELHKLLKDDPKFHSQLLRNSDATLTLEERIQKSESFGADLFISIHANANPSRRAKGAEFYIQNQLPMDEESLFLAHNEHMHSQEKSKPRGDVDSIVSDLEKSDRILRSYQISSYMRKNWSKTKSKMIRQGPFFVLTQSKIPAVLVEVGYLTNARERSLLIQKSQQRKIAKKIHGALSDYAKNMDKLPSGILQPQNAKTR